MEASDITEGQTYTNKLGWEFKVTYLSRSKNQLTYITNGGGYVGVQCECHDIAEFSARMVRRVRESQTLNS